PGFRVAAVGTAIVLGMLGILAVSKLVSQLTRRSTSTQIVSKAQGAPQSAPFVATPREAQEYKEEPPPPQLQNKVEETPVVKQKVEEPSIAKQKEQARAQVGSDVSSERNAHKLPGAQPVQRPPATAATVPQPTTRASNAPPPTLPRGNAAGFDARLIRIR